MNAQPPTTPGGDAEPAAAGHLPPDVLSDLLDGRLPAEARDRALAHCEVCAHCRAERDALGHVVALGSYLRATEPVPPEVWPLVAAVTLHERTVRRAVLRSACGRLVAAALVLCALSAWLGVVVGRELARRERRAGATAERTLEREMRELEEKTREADRRARGLRP